MTETKTQWEPTGLERFGHLEDKIFRMVEEFKSLRKENENLQIENELLKGEVADLRGSETAARNDLAQFQKEREELRERVEKALSLIATMDPK